MKAQTIQHSVRMPRELYEDAVDVAAVFGMNVNRLILEALRGYLGGQLEREVVRNAVDRVREARKKGLDPGPVNRRPRAST